MKSRVVLLFLMLNSFVMTPQQLQMANLEELGISFEVPKGWSGQMEAEYILLGHQTLPGFMVLTKNEAKNLEDLKAKVPQGLHKDGISLALSQEVKAKGETRAEGHYEGTYQGKNVKAYAIGLLNPYGNGNFGYYYNQMNTMDTVDASAHQALRDENTGTYEIYYQNGNTWVDLNFNNGKVNSYRLTTDNAKQKTLLNGVRYYITGEQAYCG